jgi:type IV secretory pathway TraG/TraD family ATPase VirD4
MKNMTHINLLHALTGSTEHLLDKLIGRIPSVQSDAFTARFEAISTLAAPNGGGWAIDGRHCGTLKDAYKNALITGQSGCGKSTSILAGSAVSLSKSRSSMCVLDPAGEVHKWFSGYFNSIGYRVFSLDVSSLQTDGYNDLEFCKSVQDCAKLAQVIIANGGVESKTDQYWSVAAELTLLLFIRYVVFHCPDETKSLGSVLKLINEFMTNPTAVDILFSKCENDEGLLRDYRALLAQGERLNSNILSTIRAAMKPWTIPNAIRATSKNTIPFSEFRHTPSILFISTPLPYIKLFAPIIGMLFSRIFSEIMRKIPEPTELSIFCILEEMLLYRVPDLSIMLSNCRKYRAGCLCITQDYNMIKSVYSEADCHGIKTNSYLKVFCPSVSNLVARELSENLGRYSLKDGGSRRLMEQDEIMKMRDTLFFIGQSASRGKLYPFYDNPILRRYTSMPQLPFPDKLPAGMPPLIHFDNG